LLLRSASSCMTCHLCHRASLPARHASPLLPHRQALRPGRCPPHIWPRPPCCFWRSAAPPRWQGCGEQRRRLWAAALPRHATPCGWCSRHRRDCPPGVAPGPRGPPAGDVPWLWRALADQRPREARVRVLTLLGGDSSDWESQAAGCAQRTSGQCKASKPPLSLALSSFNSRLLSSSRHTQLRAGAQAAGGAGVRGCCCRGVGARVVALLGFLSLWLTLLARLSFAAC
jgi:hypothetical protein